MGHLAQRTREEDERRPGRAPGARGRRAAARRDGAATAVRRASHAPAAGGGPSPRRGGRYDGSRPLRADAGARAAHVRALHPGRPHDLSPRAAAAGGPCGGRASPAGTSSSRARTGPAGGHGTFRDAQEMLPRIAELGFDVVYLPPIHPIGHTYRKGRNNSLTPEAGRRRQPVGDRQRARRPHRRRARARHGGGLRSLRAPAPASSASRWRSTTRSSARPTTRGCTSIPTGSSSAPTAPSSTPRTRPRSTRTSIRSTSGREDREALWNACRDVLLFWIARGVKTFRVDNPHTKPFAFWEWVIREVQREHPDTVFLAEAFTRPSKLLNLAKLGFTQSYTYFTWKNTAPELREFLAEFSRPDVLEYYRGNFFANTPDILHEYLQQGGMPAFRIRLLLAGTSESALRDLQRLRVRRERGGARGERGVPGLGEVPGAPPGVRRRGHARSGADDAQPHPAPAAGAAAGRQPAVHPVGQRSRPHVPQGPRRYARRGARRRPDRRRHAGSVGAAGDGGTRADGGAGPRPRPGVPGGRPAHRRAVHLARQPELHPPRSSCPAGARPARGAGG